MLERAPTVRTSADAATYHVDADGECDHESDHHLLPESGDVEQIESVPDDRENQRADERSEGFASTARQAGATDDDRRDGIEFVGCRGLWLCGLQPGREHQTGDTGEQSAECVDACGD